MKSTANYTLVAVAICMAQQRAIATDAPSPSPIAIESTAPSDTNFSRMVGKDIGTRHREQAQEIERIAQRHEAQAVAAQSALQADVNRHERNAREILASIIASKDSPLTSAEALLKLAIIESSANQKNAQKLVRQAIETLGNRDTEVPTLGAKAYLFAAELAQKQLDFKEARRSFARAAEISNIDRPETRELLLRARIGEGDTAFEEYHFEDADSSYLLAIKVIQTADPILRNSFQAYQGPLTIRRLWATFRSGRYAEASKVAADLARQLQILQHNLDKEVLSDIINSSGIALAEKNDKVLLQDIVSDNRSGEFGKDMVIACIRHLLRTGRVVEAESVALAVDAAFIRSNRLVDFMQERWNTVELLNDPVKMYEVGPLLVERLSYDSNWRKETLASLETEEKRSKLVAKISLETADKLLQVGKKSNNTLFLKKAHRLFQSHLLEPVATSGRATGYLKSGEAALLSRNFGAAWSNTKASLSYNLTRDQKRSAYHQLVSIALDEANSSSANNFRNLTKYLETVDAFVRAFPEDASARLALFESGRKLENIGKTAEARERFERLLAQSSEWTIFDNHEREDVVLALLALNARDADTKRSTNSVNSLERQFDHEPLAPKVKDQIQVANAAAIRAHAASLRTEGKLEQALREEMLWAHENAHNSETPFLLTDIAKGYFELGQLRQCNDASSLFLANYRNHHQKHQALYWKARALEGELAFLPAANAFVAAAWDDQSSLTTEERADALTRAQQIFSQLENKTWSARTREKLFAVHKPIGKKSHAILLLAAEDWLGAKQYSEAEKVFLKLLKEPSTPRSIALQSQLGLQESRISNSNTQALARSSIAKLAHSFSKSKEKVANTLLNKATLVALESDLEKVSLASASTNALTKVSQTAADSAKLFSKFRDKLSASTIQKASILLAAIQGKLSERYSLAAESQTVANSWRSDKFMQEAEKLKMSARSTLFSAVRLDESGRAETANALAALGSQITSGSEPGLELIEPKTDTAVEALKGFMAAKNNKDKGP